MANEPDPVDEILRRWRQAWDEGDRVPPGAVIGAFPEYALQLRARFAAIGVEDGAPESLRASRLDVLRSVGAGRYSEFKVLGRGGMGIVYWALDSDLGRQVAFKIVRPDAGRSDAPVPEQPLTCAPPAAAADAEAARMFANLRARFLQEAWITAGLEHPGIVPVYEVGQNADGVPYYTMRFVRGSRTLAASIEALRARPVDERLALIDPLLKVCDTLRYAHARGVVHRDLKPDNVALGEFGEVVVLDWGLAKITGAPDAVEGTWQDRIRDLRAANDLATKASALGTPGYMAPEAALGRMDEVDAKSDVYSLGVMLFQILTGRLPYEAPSYVEFVRQMFHDPLPVPSRLDPAIPEGLSDICLRALARDRAARTPTVDAFAAEIRKWMAEREREAEADALFREAAAARWGIERVSGEELIRRVDRLQGLCARVLAVHPGHERALALAGEAETIQERAISEREMLARQRIVRRGAIVALLGVTLAAGAFSWFVHDRRADTERRLDEVHASERRLQEALADETARRLRLDALRLAAESRAALAAGDRSLAALLAIEAEERQSLDATRVALSAVVFDGDPGSSVASLLNSARAIAGRELTDAERAQFEIPARGR